VCECRRYNMYINCMCTFMTVHRRQYNILVGLWWWDSDSDNEHAQRLPCVHTTRMLHSQQHGLQCSLATLVQLDVCLCRGRITGLECQHEPCRRDHAYCIWYDDVFRLRLSLSRLAWRRRRVHVRHCDWCIESHNILLIHSIAFPANEYG